MAKKQPAAQEQQPQDQQEQATQQAAQAQEIHPMHLDVRVRPMTPKGNLMGYASVNINGCFAVDGIKVVSGKNGLFINMPSYQVNGQYRDVCFPVTKEFHAQLSSEVVTGYHQALEQMQTASQEAQQRAQEAQQQPEPAQAMA